MWTCMGALLRKSFQWVLSDRGRAAWGSPPSTPPGSRAPSPSHSRHSSGSRSSIRTSPNSLILSR
eukprot:6646645-Pyramimonas_sp.AAC.2